jgi:prepilin-type N-terminal cleavage/methylation domain-containing protein
MSFFQDTRGFSLIEVMVAVMVLTLGLTGVAGMQIKALNGTFAANSNSTGSGIALAWAEWLDGLMNHTDQEKIVDNTTNMWTRENLRLLTRLDTDPNDTMVVYHLNATPPVPFTEYELPSSIADIVKCFNGQKAFVSTTGQSKTLTFRKEGGTLFTAADLPPPAPAGARLVLRIAANVPCINTATIEVSLPYTNAFVKKRGATLHFVVASNM